MTIDAWLQSAIADAERRGLPELKPLLDRLVALLRPRGLLVTDNVLWNGEVVPGFSGHPTQNPEDTRAIAEYNERLAGHPLLQTAIVPLRDGVSISVKTDRARG